MILHLKIVSFVTQIFFNVKITLSLFNSNNTNYTSNQQSTTVFHSFLLPSPSQSLSCNKVFVSRKCSKYHAVQFGTIPFEPCPEDRYRHGHPIIISRIHQLRVLKPYPPPKTIRDCTIHLRTSTGEHAWDRNQPRVFNTDRDLSTKCEFIFLEEIIPLDRCRWCGWCGWWKGRTNGSPWSQLGIWSIIREGTLYRFICLTRG